MLAIVKSHQPSFAFWDLEIPFSTSGVMNLPQEGGQGLFPLLPLHVLRLRVNSMGLEGLRIIHKILHYPTFLLAWLMEEWLWVLDTQDRVTSAPPWKCPSPTMSLPPLHGKCMKPLHGPSWTFLTGHDQIRREQSTPTRNSRVFPPFPGPMATSQVRAQRC